MPYIDQQVYDLAVYDLHDKRLGDNLNGILKADGNGNITIATNGVDYSAPLRVTLTGTAPSITSDKTASEINTAYAAGTMIYAVYGDKYLYLKSSSASSVVFTTVDASTSSTITSYTIDDNGDVTVSTYSSSAEIDARKFTNPNLLDNWWFGNPINQRGLTTYSGSGQLKTIDRWILFNGSGTNSLSVQSGYISVKSDSNGFGQFVEDSVGSALNGKTVTCSVMFNDGSITSATGIYSNSSLVSLGNGFYIGLNGGKQTIVSYLTGITAKNIKAMKVELGTISTLANDTPPDYGEELTRCIYSTADPTDTYANNGFGRSNENLFANWYLVGGGSQLGDGIFPINQRGQTQYTAAGFVFDRWFKSGGVTVDLASDGVTITNGNGWPDGINQRFPTYYFAQFNGKPLTVSVLLSDGTIVSGTVTVDASQNYQWVKYPEANEIGFQLKNFQYGATYDYFDYISIAVGVGGNAIKIRAVKLELGTVSTLANDAPPDFGEELRKCQRYLRYVSLKRLPVFCDANYLVAMTTLEGIEMRATPTPSLVSAGYIFNPATSATSVPTAVSILAFEYNTVTIQLSIPASFNGSCIAVDSAICLSAEL